MEPGLIDGFSFLSLVTGDEAVYNKVIDFYSNFGFLKIKEFDHSKPDVSAHSLRSLKEAWLNALPDRPFDATDASGDNGTTIKVRLTGDGPSASFAAKKVEQFLELTKVEDWRGISASIVLHTSDIERTSRILDHLSGNSPETPTLQYRPDDISPIEVYAVDPVGTIIGFTSKKNPFTLADKPVMIQRGEKFGSSLPSTAPSVPSAGIQSVNLSSLRRKRIGVMTSGGDAPGMNAAVRAVVRTAIARGCEAYAIYEGYEGLVRGGDQIKEMTWDDVRGWLATGGTAIGTARCAAFREREGRLKAAKNMIISGIDALIICGGDGSLTGADLFRAEWPSLLNELVEKKDLTKDDIAGHEHLYICGLVGSIDNDMASTDATIGAYSSLDRICQAIDYIDATAQSHSRAFVIEVMGRHCGWLALMAGIATGADHVFIPERPADPLTWQTKLCKSVSRHRERGKRKTIVIVAEGAIDSELNPVTPSMVLDVLVKLGLDTRITTLGHVQRGGNAVAFDRLLATLQGVDAVDAILSSTPETPSPMIGIVENKIVRRSLVEAVKLTKSVAEAIEAKEFDKAMSLRDTEFADHFENFVTINSADHLYAKFEAHKRLNIAIINIGAPAGGMNTAIRAAAGYCFSRGHTPYAIHNGWTGLARHESVKELKWLEVEQWTIRGGCEIGTNRNLPETDLGMIAFYFQKYEFDGLIIIGGYEAFVSLQQLEEARKSYPAFRIPMVVLPATISNNVPGTEYSLGTDTCLNALVFYCDVIKQSASASRRRVFVVEVQGGNSGFITAYAGLVTGAHATYLPEDGINLRQLESDIDYIKQSFANDEGRNRAGKLILRNENSSKTFSTQILVDIIRDEAEGRFEARAAIPGHVQQGGIPSPMDRVRATRLAIKSVQFLENQQSTRTLPIDDQNSSAVVIGIRSSKLVYTPVRNLWDFETEHKWRRPKNMHWTIFSATADMLVGRPEVGKK